MGWLNGWAYRKKITISASSSQATWQASTAYSIGAIVRPTTANGYWYVCDVAGTSGSSQPSWPTTVGATVTDGTVTWRCRKDYQVLLKIGESSGASNYNFHLEGKSASFPTGINQGGDLRFTKDDGTTLLNFWVEEISGTSPNRTANVWVKVEGDLSSKDIYCYFGNSQATNASNGQNTMILQEDADGGLKNTWTVESGTWQVQTGGGYNGSDAYREYSGTSGTKFSRVNISAYAGLHLKARMYFESDVNYGGQLRLFTGSTNQINLQLFPASNQMSLYCVNEYKSYPTIGANTWYLLDLYFAPNGNINAYCNGGYGVSTTNTDLRAFDSLKLASEITVTRFDTIFIRNYVATEPAFSSAGALETASIINYGAMLLMFLS